MAYTLSEMLKRLGITQYEFWKRLVNKYSCSLSLSTVGTYLRTQGVRDTLSWNVIQHCAKREFGIEYRNGRWEVNKDG